MNKNLHDNDSLSSEKRLLKELYWWVDLFNIAFFANEPVPPLTITVERMRVTTIASHKVDDRANHHRVHVTLNSCYIDRPLSDILQTIVHEMVHLWEQTYISAIVNNSYAFPQFEQRRLFWAGRSLQLQYRGNNQRRAYHGFTNRLIRGGFGATDILELRRNRKF